MTLTELRYIVALAQEQHFGRAAERCHVSQPTLSIAVKKLEEELGVLFERGKQKILPTPLGEKIVAMAGRVLEQAAAIKDVAEADKDQLEGPIALGTLPTIGPYLLPQFIPLLQETLEQAVAVRGGGQHLGARHQAAQRRSRRDPGHGAVRRGGRGHAAAVRRAIRGAAARRSPPGRQGADRGVRPAAGGAAVVRRGRFAARADPGGVSASRPAPETGAGVRTFTQGATLETLRHMVASRLGRHHPAADRRRGAAVCPESADHAAVREPGSEAQPGAGLAREFSAT